MIWKDIPGLNDKYSVSENGDIKYIKTGRIKTKFDNGRGYIYCNIFSGKKIYCHRAVALAFVENPNNEKQVNHKDGIKSNNHYSNLEWCNGTYNQRHARLIGLPRKKLDQSGEKNSRYKDGMRCISNEVKNCPECKNEFSGKARETIYCSKICSNRSNARIMNETWKNKRLKSKSL